MIEVGEYIKTVAGYIGIITNYDDGMYSAKMKDTTMDLYIDDILNHSKNIIDLIEEGDYVNGMEVLDIYYPRDLWEPIEIRLNSKYTNYITSDEIKEIVTKGQFNSMKYVVGEK